MFKMIIVEMSLFRGDPVQEAKRAAIINKFIADHTYEGIDWGDLPSSGEIWDDIYPLLNALQDEYDETYQAYDGYEWIVVNNSRLIMKLYLHDMGEDEVDGPLLSAYNAVMGRSVDQ